MTHRNLGFVPALAILAFIAAPALAQSGGGGSGAGGMAYPDSLKSGQVKIPPVKGRDTGSEAYPASPGGITEKAPTGNAGGGMAYPTGNSGLATTATPVTPKTVAAKKPARHFFTRRAKPATPAAAVQ